VTQCPTNRTQNSRTHTKAQPQNPNTTPFFFLVSRLSKLQAGYPAYKLSVRTRTWRVRKRSQIKGAAEAHCPTKSKQTSQPTPKTNHKNQHNTQGKGKRVSRGGNKNMPADT
jgi:hypothetical protein